MQKKIGILLFCLSVYFLYHSLTSIIAFQWNNMISSASDSTFSMRENITYSAKELGCKTSASSPASMYAGAYCVMDADTGRVLLGKNAEEKMPMASTTKIMTCILALENGNLSDTVTVSSYASTMPDVQLNIREGEQYVLKDLLYSLMLESHNDTAVAIAEHLGGTVEGFAEMMNEKAIELGCTNTNFVTPNGLDHEDHYTTASELCMIAAYAIQNKDFLEIVQTPNYSFCDSTGARSFSVTNHDAFLTQYEGAIGIKTGFTNDAGYCFCGAAKQNGETLLSAVLACGWPPNKSYKWADTKKLMDYGFEAYESTMIPICQEKITLPVVDGQKKELLLKRNDAQTLTLPLTSTDEISIQRKLPQKIKAPVRAGDIIGYEVYAVNGTNCLKVPLTAKKDIASIDYSYWLKLLGQLFLGS